MAKATAKAKAKTKTKAKAASVALSPTQRREALRLILTAKFQKLLLLEQQLNQRRFLANDGVTEGTVLERINDCFIERQGVAARLLAIGGTGAIPFPSDKEISDLSAAVRRLDHATLSSAATRDLINAAHALVATFP
jgi:hypothetical protein